MIWLPALTTTALFGAAMWLCRNLIATRLTQAVKNEFDTKLEETRAEFRRKEEQLKAELRLKESEINALRSGALTALTSRQAAVDKRRLEAIDQLWKSFTSLAPAKSISALMARIKFEVAAEHAAKDHKTRQAFEAMSKVYNPKGIDLSEASKARPFVSPTAWALFSAYQSIAISAVAQMEILKSGMSADFIDKEVIAKLAKAALPHQSEYVDQHGFAGYHWLLEELEEKLLAEIQRMLSGVEADKVSVQQAAEVLKLANELSQNAQKSVSERPSAT